MRSLACFLLVASFAWSGEYAVLQNGFQIHIDRHEIIGDKTRLYTGRGVMEFETSQISHYEQEEYVKPPEAPPPAQVQPAEPAQAKSAEELLAEAAIRNGLRPEFVRSVALAESAFRQDAISPKGAIGLMQLMPATAAELGVDPHDAAQNAEGGTRYLKQLLLKYKDRPDGVHLALAAYNAGPGAVDRYGNIPPYRETRAYVDRVLNRYLKQVN